MKKIKFGLVIVFAIGAFTLSSNLGENKVTGDIDLMGIINNAQASGESGEVCGCKTNSSTGWERCEVNSWINFNKNCDCSMTGDTSVC